MSGQKTRRQELLIRLQASETGDVLYPLALQGISLGHLAATAPDAAILRLLMERGISLDVRDSKRMHPIHWAAGKGSLDSVKLLVEEAGVSPKQRDAEGRSPLDLAAQYGHLPLVRYLIEERGMDPTKVNKHASLKRTAHVFSAEYRYPICSQGYNPLHWACKMRRGDVADYLLDKTQIDPLAKDKDGNHALVLALRPCYEREAPDQGLPILELLYRKAPQALEMSGPFFGKDMSCCSRYWISAAYD